MMKDGETNQAQKNTESKIRNNFSDFTPILAKQRKRLTQKQNFSKISTEIPVVPPATLTPPIKTLPQEDRS